MCAASSDELWMGLNDRKTERLFDWSDHSTVTYTSWEFGEPSTSGDTEDCVLMRGEVMLCIHQHISFINIYNNTTDV